MAYSRSQDQKRLKILRSQLYGKESVPDFLTHNPLETKQDNTPYDQYRYNGPHNLSQSKDHHSSSHLRNDLFKIFILGVVCIVGIVLVYYIYQNEFNDLIDQANTTYNKF